MKAADIVRRVAAALAVVAAATLSGRLTHANEVTAGLVFLISVLGLAVWQGFFAGALGSLLATACFNFFFLPPVGTFHIADPQNWVALGCFLIAALVASRLVLRERERSAEAHGQKQEIEALYNLCVDLFTASAKPEALDAATSRALRTIGARAGGLVLAPEEPGRVEPGAWIGGAGDLELHRLLERAPALTKAVKLAPGSGLRDVRLPVLVSGRLAGVLVAYGTSANQETLESVAKLVALAFERERLLAERSRLETLQASDSLKTSLLQAVSHDLSTPLTSMLLSLETLNRRAAADPAGAEAVQLLIEETSRLNRRIQNLLAMARLEAGSFAPRREPTPAADLFRSVRENLRSLASTRRIEARVAPDCPDLDVDPALALEILVNLIENAHRASPEREAIELVASSNASEPGLVRLEVLDRGGGLGTGALRLGARDASAPVNPGDLPRRGLGLEIARSFARAHGGRVELHAREGGGSRAQIDLPAAAAAALPETT